MNTATYKRVRLLDSRQICATALLLMLTASFAQATTQQEFSGTPARGTIQALQSRGVELVSKPAATLLLGKDCILPAPMLMPAALGGLNANPIQPAVAQQLRCISLQEASNAGRARSVVRPESRGLDRPASTVTSVGATSLTGATYSSDGRIPASVTFPAVTFRVPEFDDPAARTPLLTGCRQDDGCNRLAPTASPARPEGAADGDRSARETGARPRKPASKPVNHHLLPWLGLWLISWLVLLGLCALVWMVLRRRFGPEAKLVRAARAGLKNDEFRLEYQPVVSLREGRCVGVEALIRWNNAEHGSLGPAHYMSRLERTAMIGPLTRFVLSTAARELGPLMTESPLYIGINISSSHVESATFVSDVRKAGKGILSRLVLHMPESHCAKPTANVLNALAALRKKKVRFALSGVGMTPVDPGLIKVFAFELVKTDRQVLDLDSDERLRRLTGTIDAVRPFGATVVAEGVESATHHAVVSRSGADLGQGFFYGRTMIINILLTFLEGGGTSLRMQGKRRWL
ncbi:MAG TPA: EAL domain-containing protein [Paraburkholderia sp.]|uniref:EAL domain-containing protein n=1 Tax=Paraburkholderia sp. TaxID=1926495 RepID=UPI002B45F828|nr:EAL domain-containing protein [Paraburkholderia sp.]HKR43344.1 EAL domain-containing protein [Paraburkholderia sp.]